MMGDAQSMRTMLRMKASQMMMRMAMMIKMGRWWYGAGDDSEGGEDDGDGDGDGDQVAGWPVWCKAGQGVLSCPLLCGHYHDNYHH